MAEPTPLEKALASVLNYYSAEHGSHTPDFILAQFLTGCLAAWNDATTARDQWYGGSKKDVSATMTKVGVTREPNHG